MGEGQQSSFRADAALPYPGDHPDQVAELAVRLRTGRGCLTALDDGVEASLSALMQSWPGTDAESARREVTALSTAGRRLAERADATATAVSAYHDELTTIRHGVDVIRADWTELFARPPAVGGVSAEAELRRRWQALVEQQEVAAQACRSALDTAATGGREYAPGSGVVRGDLGGAIGLDALTFDDRFRAAARVDPTGAEREWSALTAGEQDFFAELGRSRYSAQVIAGRPGSAAALWGNLAPMAQQALIHRDTADIGGTDGIPVVVRDRANRRLLPDERNRVQADLDQLLVDGPPYHGVGRFNVGERIVDQDERLTWQQLVDRARNKLAALDALEAGPRPGDDRPSYLIDLDTVGRGHVVVAYGNPDTADAVCTFLPGAGSDLGGYLDAVDRSKAMVESAEQYGDTVAGVAWIDYTAPRGVPQAANAWYADTGADGVDRFVDGLRASHDGPVPFRSVVVGHSYGTLLLSEAASGERSLAADALVLVGSPGTGLGNVDQLNLDGVPAEEMPGRVFATAAGTDPIADAPIYLRDPTADGFGATVFPADGNPSPVYYNFGDHSRYWDPGSRSLAAIGAIVAGQPIPAGG